MRSVFLNIEAPEMKQPTATNKLSGQERRRKGQRIEACKIKLARQKK